MKTTFLVLFTMVFVLNQFKTIAQESCKVLKPEISGSYTGSCKDGLADGKGVAEGTDRYEGKFKKGLPNGQGTYTWSTGEVYKGSWKEGMKDGEGKFTFKSNGIDSTRIGYWKNDAFVRKKVQNPYEVRRTSGIKRSTVTRFGDGEKITLSIMKNGNNNSSLSGMTFFCTSGTTFSVGPKRGYENVTFPCTVRIIYSTQSSFNAGFISCEFEVEIKTPGIWEIVLNN